MPIQLHTLTFKGFENISPKVRRLSFSTDSDILERFIPGQFITIHFEYEGKTVRRSYSVATLPGSDEIEIAVAEVEGGKATNYLFNLSIGDTVSASGPVGRLILPKPEEFPSRLVLVATGTGITPYRAMLPLLKQQIDEHGLRVVVVLGVEGRLFAIYDTDFLEAANVPNFDFIATYSRKWPSEPRAHEIKGHVQDAFSNLNLNAAEDMIYLCGNPDMIDDCFELLKNQGFDVKNIKREKYISSN